MQGLSLAADSSTLRSSAEEALLGQLTLQRV